MKMTPLLFASALLVACSSPSGNANAPVPTPMPSSIAAMPSESATSTSASASGLVKSIDLSTKTITIAHGPVDALKWPAMTMTFQAPDADLTSIKYGDHVAFEFTSVGMNGTITKIARQQ